MRRVFWDAIADECRFAMESCRAPNIRWLKAWLHVGAQAGSAAWLIPGQVSDLDETQPLAYVGRSECEPGLLVDVVSLLVHAGDWGGVTQSDFLSGESEED